MAKRRRCAGAGAGPSSALEREQWRPQQKQHLYLILDDDPFGCSIREISLSPPTSRLTRSSRKSASSSGKGSVRRLPHPILYLEAQRGFPMTFAAINTKIVMTQTVNPVSGGEFGSDLIIPIYDVRRRAVTFGPGKFSNDCPIYIPAGDNLFDLQTRSFSKLSFEPQQPPSMDYRQRVDLVPWSWQQLPPPPFHRVDVNSYAVYRQAIVVSTDTYPGDPYSAAGMFIFNTETCGWQKLGNWTLPFTGRAYFVDCLRAFVGLSKDPATLGHLASCGFEAVTQSASTWKLGKEKLFSDDPAETHVSAKLVYTGSRGSPEFCLVQCVSVKPGNANADDKNPEEPWYRYRLTTFSLSYDDNGDLTTGETSWVQCYEVPREATQNFMIRGDPVAFWL